MALFASYLSRINSSIVHNVSRGLCKTTFFSSTWISRGLRKTRNHSHKWYGGVLVTYVRRQARVFPELERQLVYFHEKRDISHKYAVNQLHYVTSSKTGQDEPNLALWLGTRAGKMELSCSLGIRALSRKENCSCCGVLSSFFLSSFCFCVFMDRDEVEDH